MTSYTYVCSFGGGTLFSVYRNISLLSPYLTGMLQLETSSRIVRDYFATKINDINTTFMLQSH